MSENTTRAQGDQPDLTRSVLQRMIQVLAVAAIQASILFVAAGDLGWGWGWANVGVYLGVLAINLIVFSQAPHGREMMAERGQVKADAKAWDRPLGMLVGLFGPLALLIVAGLDHRFAWTATLPWWIHGIGLLLTIVGYLIVTWSMNSNAYFSGMVRIQQDRGHQVASSGPYQFVRHPGYVGMIMFNLMTALLLGSLWALIPAGVTVILFVVRTALEDSTLRTELPGYKEYAQQTRYRLLPGLW
jgi:protein-S-isoprenylcysteine O-methyltransferase Ste14